MSKPKFFIKLRTEFLGRKQLGGVKNKIITEGEKKSEKEEDRNGHRYHERRYGSFCRSIALPSSIDPDSAEAKFKDGVLSIKFGKLPEIERGVKEIPVAA